MKLILKPKDNEPHDSGSKTSRCRNITYSGSNVMVDEDERIKI